MAVLKFICLFIGIWWTIVNSGKLIRGDEVPTANLLIQTVGISWFIYLQWLM